VGKEGAQMTAAGGLYWPKYNNTMKDCGVYSGLKLYFIAFHYLSLLVPWTGINERIDICT
jgi:hypothetical protein